MSLYATCYQESDGPIHYVKLAGDLRLSWAIYFLLTSCAAKPGVQRRLYNVRPWFLSSVPKCLKSSTSLRNLTPFTRNLQI